MQELLKGQKLKVGDTLGVIGLSSPCEPERFSRGLKFLEGMGFKAKVELDPCLNYGSSETLFSCPDARAAAEALTRLFIDPEVKAIISARGGYGSARVLPYLDFKLLRRHPKPFCGFSDSSAIILALYHKAALGSIHGPSLESAFSKAAQDAQAKSSAEALIDLLTGRNVNPFSGAQFKLLCGAGHGQGPLCGGNLSTLVSLLGTPYAPALDGHILFFEEIGERPYRIHRMLLQLKLAGLLSKLGGVLLGNFHECDHPQAQGPDLLKVIREVCADAAYPVYMRAGFGHHGVNLPLPLGIKARLDGNKLEILEAPVLE
jgi:muramoyltetrapeptide carboxypeptidase